MRRVYCLYHAQANEDGEPNATVPWLCDATLLLDTTGISMQCAGEMHHGYDVAQLVQQRGEDALEPVFVWDDEAWVAVEIGDIGRHEGLREVMERVRAAPPPPTRPAPTQTGPSS
jgi:hypothetical protein